MADVSEVLQDRFSYRDLADRDTVALHQSQRVLVRVIRRAEARHRHRDDIRHRQTEQLIRLGYDEQSQRGIKSARDADDRILAVRVAHALGETLRLDLIDFAAVIGQLLRILGYEGVRRELALQIGPGNRRERYGGRDMGESLRFYLSCSEGCVLLARSCEPHEIDIGHVETCRTIGEGLGFG